MPSFDPKPLPQDSAPRDDGRRALRNALVVGSTGIVGGNLAAHLRLKGWQVFGLARRPSADNGVIPLRADLLDRASIRAAVAGREVSHVFVCTWMRHDTEEENVRVNGAMVENLFAELDGHPLQHAALVTGTKQYLGPFESYGQTAAETPFREETPRLLGLNFYYTQEDVLFAATGRLGFSWSVHRPHSIIGFALGNAMNMGVTLAVYATLCRESGRPFVFPGSHLQWNALTDATDAELLAKHLEWAATTPAAANQAFNVVDGDVFRWRWMWPQLAAYFGIEAQGPPEPIAPLEPRMGDAPAEWKGIAAKYGLVEPDIEKLVSWWHTDGDLGRQLECVNDMNKSRRLGFLEFTDTREAFLRLFDRLRKESVIPA